MLGLNGMMKLETNDIDAFGLEISNKYLLLPCCQKALNTLKERLLSKFVDHLKNHISMLIILLIYLDGYYDDTLYTCEQIPEEYKWPLTKKQRRRQKICEFPPKQSLLDSSSFDAVALYPTVNFAVEYEEHHVYNTISQSGPGGYIS